MMPSRGMDVVPPPLNTEDCQENQSARDLSHDSVQERTAEKSGNNRNRCGDQRSANIAPRIFPMKRPSQPVA
jgi:hypothetical protein